MNNTAEITIGEVSLKLLAAVVAGQDGIHPAHAENRLRAAWKLLQQVENDRFGRPFGRIPVHAGLRTRLAEQAGVKVAPDSPTWEWVETLDGIVNELV